MPNCRKKDLTDDEKFELQLQAEHEVGRLAREYNVLERSFGHTEVGSTVVKRQRVLNIFKKEESNILADLFVASADAKTKSDEQTLTKLSELLVEYDKFKFQIKTKKAHLHEIHGQVQRVQKEMVQLSGQQVTDEHLQDRVLTSRKTVEALENKLDVQIKQFCTICSENSKLRQQINHLLIERNEFNKIWDKLINNLSTGKKFMLDLIEQATVTYDQLEDWVSKLQFLRNKAFSDLNSHIIDMREMQRKVDNNNKLKEFILTKGQKRIMEDLEAKEQLKRNIKREKMEQSLEEYNEILESVRNFTGEDRIEVIVKQFLLQEEENFALFKYVNDLNKEMENLNDHLNYLYIEIDEQKALQNIRNQEQHDKLDHIRAMVEQATRDANNESKELNEIENKINTIIKGIERLFGLFKCSRDPLIQLLGHNEQINYYNVLLYLQILEHRIHEYLINVYHREKEMVNKRKISSNQMVIKPDPGPPKVYPIEKIVNSNPCPLCVEHEYVSDVIDVLQHIKDKDEIQTTLFERLRLEDGLDRLHNVSACHLPKSREIIQKRYQ